MKKILLLLTFFISISVWAGNRPQRQEKTINDSWSFILEDIPEASSPEFDDSEWRKILIPHDWALEEGYRKDGPQALKGGYASGGIGWYRRHLPINEEELKGRRLFLDFDAVYMNSEVWINGHYLGKRPYGYISFEYEITGFVHAGENIISVKVDNAREPSARWYHGCGIYGNVRLINTARSRFAYDGTFVANPECSEKEARLSISSLVDPGTAKLKSLTAEYRILSPEGKVVWEASQKKAGADSLFRADLTLKDPARWDLENPSLYTLEARLLEKGKVSDQISLRFGVRSVGWDAEKGFFLNGRPVKIQGVCEHLEGGPVGAAWPENLIRWKVASIKSMGCNSIRTSHNPQVPAFYDICDEMGILVMDEIFDGWLRKAPEDYGHQAFAEWWERDLRAWLRRDRNHPSVFVYSVGNETKGEIGKDIVAVCHAEDSTRLVTSGHSGSEFMDIFGVNGGSENQEFIRDYVSDGRAFIGTENPHTWQVRGYYRTRTWYRDGCRNNGKGPFFTPDLTDEEIFQYEWTSPDKVYNGRQHYNSSYDNAYVRINVRRSLEYLRDKPWYSGTYRWTGFDYPGECGFPHGGWPFRAFMGGVFDLAGFQKDHYHLYKSQWTDAPMAHILPHWTHPYMKEGTGIPVFVYSNAEEVELFLNGRSLGRKKCGTGWETMSPMWMVPWTPGEIKAIAYRDGRKIASDRQCTSGAPSSLRLKHEASFLTGKAEDLHIITMAIEDGDETLYPYGENRIYFHVDGGMVFSAESGCPVDTETNYNASSRKAFFGLLRAFVRQTGPKPPVFYAGAILGDKRLKLSDEISIQVRGINMKGAVYYPNDRIYYTCDGSTPTMASNLYTGPFRLKGAGCVKAIVVRNEETLMEMEEHFGPEEGIYWNEDLNQGHLAGQQAESADLVNAPVESRIKGFQSNGYAVLKDRTSSIGFYQENDGAAGTVKVAFAYLAEKAGARTLTLSNGTEKSVLELDVPAEKAGKWQVGEFSLPLDRGANEIRLQLNAGGRIAIDWFDLK